jgi:hypothetical protein
MQQKSMKIKLKKLACFSDPKNCPSTHHDSPAIHHNFTTQKPRQKHTFSQNPLQKRTSTTQEKNSQTKTA